MRVSLPFACTYRTWFTAALLSLSATIVTATPVTRIQGKQGSAVWTTSTTAPATATVSTELLSFTTGTGASAVTYSTGLDNGMLVPGSFTPANFQAFVPLATGLTANASTLTAWANGMVVQTPYPNLTWFLSDGTQGLELGTAIFNAPSQSLNFPITIPSSASLSVPAILTTQVGDPGTTDTYYFVNSSNVMIGTPISVSYGSVASVGNLSWKFFTATGGTSAQPPGLRPLRMQSYTLADFGLNASTVGSAAAFRQVLSGQSDLAFVAYNRDLLAIKAPDLSIDLTNLPTAIVLGASYSGSFACTNIGANSATVGTSCTLSGLPAGLSVGACTISGAGAWSAGNSIPVGSTVTCPVAGIPTAAGTTTATGSTNGSSTTVVGGTPVVTADSDMSNNTATKEFAVLAVDMQVSDVDLPAGVEGAPYSGSFVCTNAGNMAAANATCISSSLPSWTTVLCTPPQPVNPLAVGQSMACSVTGTPPTGSNGTTPVTITAGSNGPEANPVNNTASGNIVIAGVPDMRFASLNLPAATVGAPYSGSFTCTNSGTAAAPAATCTPSGVPSWATVMCTPPMPVSSLAVNGSIACTVTGTPTVNDRGTSAVTVTAGPNNPDSNPNNNTGAGSIVVTGVPDMQFTSVNLPATTVGVAYSGSFVCTNGGTEPASAATCAPTGLPSWLTTTCTPTTPVASLEINATISCNVTGTPTVNDKGTSDVTITAGPNSPDANPNNNTGTGSIVVSGEPDMQVTQVELPAATVGTAYSGSFVCTNAGTEAAAAATCSPAGLPAWTTVTCTPPPPVSSLGINEAISCTVTGTPATGDKGTSTVTITAGTSTTESNPDNNTGTGSIVVTGEPHVVIDLSGMPPNGTVNQTYNGSFTCENRGTADADAAPCTVAGLPNGLTIGACTISPSGAPWTSPGNIPEAQTVTCPVSGSPTAPGRSELIGTGGTSTDTGTITVVAAFVAPVPTMSEWALMLMTSLLAGLGLVGARRMQRRG
ncbi:IPTL-CTERM sorting domain-containing protein [Ottowia thiooxydans]|uniref:IPTL-CTERM protein sorting domain-containing protein n=1 Tax=Ottowia thiooxydans TaxID=219182 RepID=A0ABV2QFV8_9BURK